MMIALIAAPATAKTVAATVPGGCELDLYGELPFDFQKEKERMR